MRLASFPLVFDGIGADGVWLKMFRHMGLKVDPRYFSGDALGQVSTFYVTGWLKIPSRFWRHFMSKYILKLYKIKKSVPYNQEIGRQA